MFALRQSVSEKPLPEKERLNPFIAEQLETLFTCKRILCLGETSQESALYLADKGVEVEWIQLGEYADFSVQKRAKEHYISLQLRHTSLDAWQPFALNDALICTHMYPSPSKQTLLFEKMAMALRENGILIAEFLCNKQPHLGGVCSFKTENAYDFNAVALEVKRLGLHPLKLSKEMVYFKASEKDLVRASVIRLIAQKDPSFQNNGFV